MNRQVPLNSEKLTMIREDVSELGRTMDSYRREHEATHDKDREARQARTRWIVTVLIAGLAAIEAPLAYLVAHIH